VRISRWKAGRELRKFRVPVIVVVIRVSPHRIVQTIRAHKSVTVQAYSLAAACSRSSGEVRRDARALSFFAAYSAALDLERTAAAMCAESISELERWLPGSDPDRGCEPRAASG
jgi:hypothetical protein